MWERTLMNNILLYKHFTNTEEFEEWQVAAPRHITSVVPVPLTVNINENSEAGAQAKLIIGIMVTYLKFTPPEVPPVRQVCDWCGELPKDGKHTSWICRLFSWGN